MESVCRVMSQQQRVEAENKAEAVDSVEAGDDLDELLGTGDSKFDCRMYESKYPEVDDVVIVRVKSIAEMGAYVSLLEYNNIEGMILMSELSRRRIRSVNKLIRVGRLEVVTVLRVDKERGYIDLSKRRVQPEDIQKMDTKWMKSKAVHSIMKYVATRMNVRLTQLNEMFTWPLYKKYGHAYDALKLMVSGDEDAQSDLAILDGETQKILLTSVERRLAPQAVKIRADIELTCFGYEGIDAIKASLQAGLDLSSSQYEISVKLVAPPLYVVTTSAMDKEEGISCVEKVCEAIQKEILDRGGKMNIKVAARAVTERDEHMLTSLMERLEAENREVEGDDDDEDE